MRGPGERCWKYCKGSRGGGEVPEDMVWVFCFRVKLLLMSATFVLNIEFEREDDGRWIAEVPELPGVMSYCETKEEALSKAQALAFRVLADRIEQDIATRSSVTFNIRGQVA